MKIEIQSLYMASNKWINMLIDKKYGEIMRTVQGNKRCQVFLRLYNENLKKNKIIEVKISAYGRTIFGYSQAESFEKAIRESSTHISKQIKKLEKVVDLTIN